MTTTRHAQRSAHRRSRRAWVLGAAVTLMLAALGVVESASASRASSGQPYSATLSPAAVTSGGAAQNVTFTLALVNESAKLSIKSANVTAPSGFTLVSVAKPAVGSATIAGGVIQLRNLYTKPKTTSTYSFVATVPVPSGSSAVYTWGVEAKPTCDFKGTNDHDDDDFDINVTSSRLTTTVTKGGDLAVGFGNGSTPGDQPDPVTPGNDVLYTLTVTNNGPAAQSSVSLTSNLAGGATFGQVPAAGSGAGWSCTLGGGGSSATCAYSGGFGSGAASTLQMWVHAPASPSTVSCGSGSVSGICHTVSVSGSAPDQNTANNSAAEATTVSAAACPAGTVSCARSFINFSTPSTVSTGSAATSSAWLVGSTQFPATGSTGGVLYAMDAYASPGSYCPTDLSGGAFLAQCDFEMRIDPVPGAYTGQVATLSLECAAPHCVVGAPGTVGGFALVKLRDNSTSPQLLSRCSSPFATGLCYDTGVASNGNFTVTVRNIPPGDPKFAGKCYVQCTPAIA